MSRDKIANVLREYRQKKNLKATVVGQMIGKSGKTVSGWEHGVGQPDIDTLMKLCIIYGIDSFDVFRDEADRTLSLSKESLEVASAYEKTEVSMKSAIRRLLNLEPENS